MPNEQLIVPSHPSPVPDLNRCRRCSVGATLKQDSHDNHHHLVVPLMSSTNKSDPANHQGSASSNMTVEGNMFIQGQRKIDPVAISLAAKAKRQQENNNNRRGSLDANVEYAVAMVNIVDPVYDMDDRDMCPFGTRRDSVCGKNSNNGEGPTRILRRNLKRETFEEPSGTNENP